MDPITKARCNALSDEAKSLSRVWADSFSDDYTGKVMFSLALANAVYAICGVTPGFEGTGDAFVEAVKAGTVIWVEAGEPRTKAEMEKV